MVVPTGVALVAVLVVCFVRRTGARRTCLYLALTAYVGAVAAVTLFPLPVEGGMGYAPTWGISYNLVPFAVDDVILNVAGGLIGFGLWKAWERLAAPKRDELV